jgi:lipopolysaccharide transport system permease protein
LTTSRTEKSAPESDHGIEPVVELRPLPAAAPPEEAPAPPEEVVIDADAPEANYWRDVWRYRELLLFLAWRDVTVQYQQTAIGVAWAVLRPLLTMIIFTVIFGRIARLDSGGVPYPILVFAGLLPWQLFANALAESSNSLIGNANLLTKVYFPRILVPAAAVLAGLADFLITFVLLVLLMAFYPGYTPNLTWRLLLLPAFLALALAAALGVGLWLAALNVKYRDFRYVVPFLIQFGLYISPVGFSSALVPGHWRLAYSANPLVGVIDGFRWCLLGDNTELYLPGLGVSVALVAVLLYTAVVHFRRVERTFADVI